MKNKIIILLASLFVGVMLFSACEKDILDKTPLDSYSDASVFGSVSLSQAYVNALYQVFPNWNYDWWSGDRNKSYALSCITDEAYNQYNLIGSTNWNTGAVTADNNYGYDTWNYHWGYVQRANYFLSKAAGVPLTSPAEVTLMDQTKGEVFYIRAYSYYIMAIEYGGLPLISKPFELNSDFNVARSGFKETVDFIVADLDKAASLLPVTRPGSELGRLTQGAALALKSRILLHLASPQWNASNDMALWQKASDAALSVINSPAGYTLSTNYADIYTQRTNPEIIYQHFLYGGGSWGAPGGSFVIYETFNAPSGFHGWAGYTPTQNLVDAYNMTNGKLITDPASGYNPQNPYKDRDSRLFATVLYDSVAFISPDFCKWRYSTNGRTTNITQFWEGGYDSAGGAGGGGETKTGYTFKKYFDTSFNYDKGDPEPPRTWIVSRLGEIYLNYAEAQFNLGHADVAATYMNKLRKRAGITTDLAASDVTMARIQNERQVELAYEGFRFFDVRRWKIADVVENMPLMGMKIVKNPDNSKTYTPKVVITRKFVPAMYLFPIPKNELDRVKIQQNPGY